MAAESRSNVLAHREVGRLERHMRLLPSHIIGTLCNQYCPKLTWEKVREIRRLRTSGLSLSQLQAQFGVSRQWVCKILKGEYGRSKNTGVRSAVERVGAALSALVVGAGVEAFGYGLISGFRCFDIALRTAPTIKRISSPCKDVIVLSACCRTLHGSENPSVRQFLRTEADRKTLVPLFGLRHSAALVDLVPGPFLLPNWLLSSRHRDSPNVIACVSSLLLLPLVDLLPARAVVIDAPSRTDVKRDACRSCSRRRGCSSRRRVFILGIPVRTSTPGGSA